jgi:hypothetical protein
MAKAKVQEADLWTALARALTAAKATVAYLVLASDQAQAQAQAAGQVRVLELALDSCRAAEADALAALDGAQDAAAAAALVVVVPE